MKHYKHSSDSPNKGGHGTKNKGSECAKYIHKSGKLEKNVKHPPKDDRNKATF